MCASFVAVSASAAFFGVLGAGCLFRRFRLFSAFMFSCFCCVCGAVRVFGVFGVGAFFEGPCGLTNDERSTLPDKASAVEFGVNLE